MTLIIAFFVAILVAAFFDMAIADGGLSEPPHKAPTKGQGGPHE